MFRLQSIDQVQSKIKALLHYIDKNEAYMAVSMIFVAISAYFIGRIEGIGESRPEIRVEQCALAAASTYSIKTIQPVVAQVGTSSQKYVASKTGKKYHLADCIGAKSIADNRKIWFTTKVEAEKAGYTPAQNCKEIQAETI